MTLISQTVDEFITDETSKKIFDQCDIKQVFRLEDISEEVAGYLNLTHAEQSFIVGTNRRDQHAFGDSGLKHRSWS